jgi:hypothetical protein
MRAMAMGFHWLFVTEQPEGALIQHHGWSLRAEEYQLGFVPQAWEGHVVIVLDLGDNQFRDEDGQRLPPGKFRGLSSREISRARRAIQKLGGDIISEWNGEGCASGSFALSNLPQASLVAAVDRYRRGCRECNPDHGNVFCSDPSHLAWREGWGMIRTPRVYSQ